MRENPLLDKLEPPLWNVPFKSIRVDHFVPALQACALQIREVVESVVGSMEPPSFQNTITPINRAFDQFRYVSSTFSNALNVHGTPELQTLAPEVSQISAQLSSDLNLNEKLFLRVREIFDSRTKVKLSQEEQKLLENTFREFKRNGALLNSEQKAKLRALDLKLSQLAPKFSENLLKATQAFELHLQTPKEVEGLSDLSLASAQAKAQAKGLKGYVFGLDAATFVDVLTHCKNRQARETLWRAYSSRCLGGTYDNTPVLKETARLRHERAVLLGYPSHAAFQLEERMAGSPERVWTFLERLREVSLKKAKEELRELRPLQLQITGQPEIAPWDLLFLKERLKEDRFQIRDEEIRSYLPLRAVLAGLFELLGRLYHIEFRRNQIVEVYHEDVECYEVWDAKKVELLGVLYCDFFHRPNKRPGAWCGSWQEQGQIDGRAVRPVVSVVTNFAPPPSDHDSLLSFDDANTLFHEFGHALHHLLSQCEHPELSGTNVYWDFVELPSQFMENWLYEPLVLKSLTRHYRNQSPMSDELIQRIVDSSVFMVGYTSIRQIMFAMLDLHWHSPIDFNRSLSEIESEAIANCLVLPVVPNTSISTSFAHVFAGGYSAGYYSYKWAEVLDADAFEYFKSKGLFDTTVAASFRREILERGGTEDPMELYKKFRGREPDVDALLRRDGLL